MNAPTWTEDEIALTTRMWTDGLSAAQISRALEHNLGSAKSRNAVIGKVTRMGLAARVSHMGNQWRPRAAPRLVSPRVVVMAPKPVLAAHEEDAMGKRTFELERRDCKWPIGEATGVDQVHCGQHTAEGEVYCPRHRKIAGGKVVQPLVRASGHLPWYARS